MKGFTHRVELSAPAEDCVAIEFFPGVKIASEPVVTNAAGKAVPSKVLLNMELGKLMMTFDAAGGGKFTLHYGGSGSAARSTKRWDPTPSLLMEVRSKPDGSLSSASAVKKIFNEGKPQGMMFVPNIFHGFNLFGPNEAFLTRYSGELNIAEDVEYRVFTASCDGSFVFIDDQPAFQWAGAHSADGGLYGQFGRDMHLIKGKHKIEYWHGYLGTTARGRGKTTPAQACMALGWQKKPAKKTDPWVPVPAGAFVHTPMATAGVPVRKDGSLGAHFTFYQDTLLTYEKWQYVRYNFTSRVSGKADSLVWDFGDGVTSSENNVSHVFTDIGPYRVKLTVKAGEKSDVCEIEVPFLTPMSNAVINDLPTAKSFAGIVGTYPFDKLPAKVLGRCFELVDTLEQPLKLQRMAEVLYTKYPGGPLARRVKRILVKCYSINDPKKALPLLQELADSGDPSAQEAKVDLLELYLYRFHDYEKVKKLAESYIASNAKESTIALIARVKMGDVYLVQGDIKKAEEAYRAAQAISYGEMDRREIDVRASGHAEIVSSHINTGKLRAAREAIIDWEAQFPVSKITGDFILISSRYWEAVGDPQRALDEMGALLKINPLTPYLPQIEYRMGNAFRDLGQPGKARALYEKVIKEYPNNPVCAEARTAVSTLPLR